MQIYIKYESFANFPNIVANGPAVCVVAVPPPDSFPIAIGRDGGGGGVFFARPTERHPACMNHKKLQSFGRV